MAQNVSGNVKLSVEFTESLEIALSVGSIGGKVNYNKPLAAGTGADKIQASWTKSATAAAAPVTYTLTALLDDLGRTIPMALVRLIVLVNLGTAPLKIGGATVAPWAAPFGDVTDKLVVPPGGVALLTAPDAAGLAVVADTSDQLKIDPGAATVPFQLMFLGE